MISAIKPFNPILPSDDEIEVFSVSEDKSLNGTLNEIRENIIGNINYIDDDYFNNPIYGNQWKQFKEDFDKSMRRICPSFSYYKIKRMGGRSKNFDFTVLYYDKLNNLLDEIKLEFRATLLQFQKRPNLSLR